MGRLMTRAADEQVSMSPLISSSNYWQTLKKLQQQVSIVDSAKGVDAELGVASALALHGGKRKTSLTAELIPTFVPLYRGLGCSSRP